MQTLLAFFYRIRALILKEFITVLKDPGSRKILVVPVIVQSILFGYGATFNLERVPWVLLDESRSAASAEFVRAVSNNGIFDLVAAETGLAGYRDRIDRGEALIGIHIPADFARRQETGLWIMCIGMENVMCYTFHKVKIGNLFQHRPMLIPGQGERGERFRCHPRFAIQTGR